MTYFRTKLEKLTNKLLAYNLIFTVTIVIGYIYKFPNNAVTV